MTRAVAILVFDEVEILDACGPFEVFSVASRVAGAGAPGRAALYSVTCVSVDGQLVRARGGLRIGADAALADAAVPDIALVPGGVTAAVERHPRVLDWVQRVAPVADRVLSVCTGAFVLAEAGLLDGLEVTTHWEDQAELAERFPRLHVVDGPRFVVHDRIATSAGVSAGIDLALHIVELEQGVDLARATARQMDYPWASGV
jgi:transcriptional regulator GlxA family with amidase domain